MRFNTLNVQNKDLPKVLTLLPLHGVILMPRSELKLSISDFGNFLSITDALHSDNYMGLVQFRDDPNAPSDDVFRYGCAGRIWDIGESGDGQLVLVVRGVCRFEIVRELPPEGAKRAVEVSYDKYPTDIVHEADFSFDRQRLMRALKNYYQKLQFPPNWEELSEMSNERLITLLMMACPFDSRERQALLEMDRYVEQSQLVTSLIELDSFTRDSLSYH
ncbi:MAG: LON peptidase substrate-binding domain-containing protein [Holosporales bacterium]|jgi:Lon protease-like protein|nr:LON peptidase substrate-binding domain-containing protein [Holosporales bacterium]